MTLYDLWAKTAASLSSLITPPQRGAELWFDDRNIPFLQENADDRAEIRVKNAQALRALVDGGFNADAAVEYIQTNDLARLLGQHSGLLSVQIQPPGTDGQSLRRGLRRPATWSRWLRRSIWGSVWC